MNKPKTHNNAAVATFLEAYYCASELCEEFPRIDDIFSGVLAAKTAGDTATRSLSRSTLFHILQFCPVIDVESVKEATHGRFSDRTLHKYAAAARVASMALERFIEQWVVPDTQPMTLKQAQQAIDAPYRAELLASGLI